MSVVRKNIEHADDRLTEDKQADGQTEKGRRLADWLIERSFDQNDFVEKVIDDREKKIGGNGMGIRIMLKG